MALDHSKSPPIGANMMPIAKKIGMTVLGVRIGLFGISNFSIVQTRELDLNSLPRFQSLLSESSICVERTMSDSLYEAQHDGGSLRTSWSPVLLLLF